jgi:hypothetical protein
MAAAHRGQTRWTRSADPPDSGWTSAQAMWGNRSSRVRLSASPHSVWLVPGIHACTSPAGVLTPSSGSTQVLDAATAARLAMWPGLPARRTP